MKATATFPFCNHRSSSLPSEKATPLLGGNLNSCLLSASAMWKKLQVGEYDWAHLPYTIWPERVKKVCERDRSLAIAYGLEHLCKVEAKKSKGKPKNKGDEAETIEIEWE